MKLIFDVTTRFEIEVDQENYVVKDYESDDQLARDVVYYGFSPNLPVVSSGGVKLIDEQITDVEFIDVPKDDE